MIDYKQEIENTRKGCVGSSDANMLRQISLFGVVPRSSWKRIAVAKGIIPNMEIPYTDAVRFGDEMEQAIFQYLKSKDGRYESNPCFVSKVYSRKNVTCITHPDIVLKDEESKTIHIYEVKTTKDDTDTVRHKYKAQLYHHFLLGREYAQECGRDWKIKLSLVHYNTEGLDLSQEQEFDVDRLTIRPVRFSSPVFNLTRAMDILDAFMATFDEYYEDDVADFSLLPETVKERFLAVKRMLVEIKEREEKIEEFKAQLYDFLVQKNVKSIKSEDFTMVRIDPSKSKSFDYKRYLEDVGKEHPRLLKKIMASYEKETQKKGYVSIKLNDK
jgi:predicted GNAT superfamily acetyltransferase